MESKQIEVLVEKYFDAEISLREEEELRAYFSSGDVAPGLEAYKPLFSYFEGAREERFTGTVDYGKKSKKMYSWIAVAASIVIFVGILSQQSLSGNEYGTYEDPELAMKKTKEALEMVALYMNSGTEDLQYLEEFNKAKKKIIQ